MKTNKNIDLINKMEHSQIKVISIDKSKMVYLCDDGNEYPLMDGLENITVTELQKHIDNAKDVTCDILRKIESDNE